MQPEAAEIPQNITSKLSPFLRQIDGNIQQSKSLKIEFVIFRLFPSSREGRNWTGWYKPAGAHCRRFFQHPAGNSFRIGPVWHLRSQRLFPAHRIRISAHFTSSRRLSDGWVEHFFRRAEQSNWIPPFEQFFVLVLLLPIALFASKSTLRNEWNKPKNSNFTLGIAGKSYFRFQFRRWRHPVDGQQFLRRVAGRITW